MISALNRHADIRTKSYDGAGLNCQGAGVQMGEMDSRKRKGGRSEGGRLQCPPAERRPRQRAANSGWWEEHPAGRSRCSAVTVN